MSETPANRAAAVSVAEPPEGRLARTGPAKFLRPRSPTNAIQRERLIRALDKNLDAPLTLVVGPPGFGKSTLVTQWLSHSGVPHAWLFADEHDSDPTTFVRSLIEAVARSNPSIAPKSVAMLDQDRAPFQLLLTELVEELAHVPPPFTIVIDDYQRAQSEEIDALLGILLTSVGASPSLLIISRSRPQLPFDLLSAYGEVTVLDVSDLKFTLDESRAMIRQIDREELNSSAVDSIVERSGGWAVGLRLLTLSADHSSPSPDAEGIGKRQSADPEVANFLFAEVIDQQPADLRVFLLRTAILEFLQPEFCDAITGRTDSSQVLQQLAARDLFTHVDNRDAQSYRYHPLFREALLLRQADSFPSGEISALHDMAAAHFLEAGNLEWATHHYIVAENWDAARELIHRQASAWMLDDQLSSIESWTGRTPQDALLGDSFLTFCRLWSLVRLGRLPEAGRLLEQARALNDLADDPYIDLRLDLIEAYDKLYHFDSAACLHICRRRLANFPWSGTFEHLAFLMVESLAYMYGGNPVVAETSLSTTRQLVESTGRQWIDSAEANCRGHILLVRGQNQRAKSVFKQSIQFSERLNAQPLVYAHLLLAQASLESMELRSARSNALRCLNLASAMGTAVHSSPGLQVLADVASVRGDRHEAAQHIHQAIEVARDADMTGMLMDAKARQAHYLIVNGDADGAASWAERLQKIERDPQDYRQFRESAVLVRYLIVTNQIERAESITTALFDRAHACSRKRDEFEMAALGALARWHAGDEVNAMFKFRPAIRQAAANQWIFLLMHDIQLFAPLLERLRSDSELGEFATNLVRDRSHRLQVSVIFDSTGSPLTPRERDMLSGLLTGKSNRELAEEMFISEYTVKRHLSNLYTKLGVSSRAQAIAFFSNRGEG